MRYLAQLFFERVDTDGPIPAHCPEIGRCWQWTGYVLNTGYGQMQAQRRKYSAHRLALMLIGIDPGDDMVCHRCDNRSCVNPGHLFLGSAKDNAWDRDEKERGGSRKLTRTDVRRIRHEASTGRTARSIARDYSGVVAEGTIAQLIAGNTWKSEAMPTELLELRERRASERKVACEAGHERSLYGYRYTRKSGKAEWKCRECNRVWKLAATQRAKPQRV